MAKRKIMKAIKSLITPRYARLNTLKFGLAGGIVTALCVFLTTLGNAIWGYATIFTLIIYDIYGFLGYEVSLIGAVLGAVYSFIDGFILTAIFAWIYNKLI